MILCSNDFQMEDRAGSRMTQEEIDWLRANVIDASLEPGQTWFFRTSSAHAPGADLLQTDSDEDMPPADGTGVRLPIFAGRSSFPTEV